MPPAKVPGWTQSVVHSVLPQAISPVARAAPGCPHLSLQSWCRLQSLAVGLMRGDPTGCCMPAPCTLLHRPSSFCTFSTVNFSPTRPRRILPRLLFRSLPLVRSAYLSYSATLNLLPGGIFSAYALALPASCLTDSQHTYSTQARTVHL